MKIKITLKSVRVVKVNVMIEYRLPMCSYVGVAEGSIGVADSGQIGTIHVDIDRADCPAIVHRCGSVVFLFNHRGSLIFCFVNYWVDFQGRGGRRRC